MGRPCPVCPGTMLQTVAFRSVQVDACPACAGVWFDDGELRAVLDQGTAVLSELENAVTPAIAATPAASAVRCCPVCVVPLDRFQYLYNSPIALDHCHQCGGVWVDDRELLAMRTHVEAVRLARTQATPTAVEATTAAATASAGPLMHLADAWEMLVSVIRRPPWSGV